ncbi:signal peptidase [Agromyces terreus]|uniref:Signal peptidase I n=1 Tax=Agromyces terreus TaxID=424795 RepID=A0A9X2KBK9_9MICO|nr:signal peptidase I [Agromyces terreus]MCP2370466.1 signal peptidase [Agromyces terreus]
MTAALPAPPERPPARQAEPVAGRRLGRAGEHVADVVLWVAGVLGVVCIVLVVLASTMHVGIIMFKTGSMAPAIPAGSAALVREIPASEVAIGDVVTVDRADALPVTHRVIAIAGDGGTRLLTLKGDANQVPDPQPYEVDRVRIVLASVPGLAYALAWLAQPIVLLVGVVLLSGLVVWAFWPRRARTAAAAAAALLAAASVVGAPAPAAQAATIEVLRAGEVLRLVVVSDPDGMAAMAPGGTERWIVGVSADAPEPGRVRVRVVGDGAENPAFTVGVQACASRFVGDGCPAELLPGLVPTSPSPVGELLDYGMDSADQLWIAVDVTLSADAPAGASTTYRVVADGFGEEVSTDDPPVPGGSASRPGGLSASGFPGGGLGLVGAVAILAGAVTVALGAGRRTGRVGRDGAGS